MAEAHLDNPAGRLHLILENARFIISQDSNLNGIMGWARVFGIEVGTKEREIEIFHRIFEVGRLVDELEQRIALIDEVEEREAFLRPLPRFKGITPIAEARNQNFSSLIGPISEGDMIVLEFCSRHLHKFQPEPVANGQELLDLTEQVDDLFNSVIVLQLDEELKTFLLAQTERIRRGIQEYRIGGLERLRETLGDVLGATMVHQDAVVRNKDSEELKRFISIADRLIAVIEFSSKTTKLIGSVSSVLPHLLKAFSG